MASDSQICCLAEGRVVTEPRGILTVDEKAYLTRGGVKMVRMRWQDRIVIDSDLHHGDPCIKGTRIPVRVLLDSLEDGLTLSEIQEAYPQLTEADVRAARSYAAEVLSQEVPVPLTS